MKAYGEEVCAADGVLDPTNDPDPVRETDQTFETASDLLITIGARELPDPWARDLVAGTFTFATDHVQSASLTSFEGHFRVDVDMHDLTVALRDENS